MQVYKNSKFKKTDDVAAGNELTVCSTCSNMRSPPP